MADGGGVTTLVRRRQPNILYYNSYPVIIADESLLQLKMPFKP